MNKTIKEYIIITIAMSIVSIAIYFFLLPSKIIIGSVTGLAMIIETFTNLPISAITLIINAFLLILGFVLIGKEFGAKTVYASLLMPLYLAILEKLVPVNTSLTNNNVYDLVTYILILAFGQAILFRANASSGGIDIIAKIINKFLHIDLGQAVTITGLVISISSIFVYDVGTLVVSVLGTLANGFAVDYFIDGFNRKKKVCIIAKDFESIQKYIMNNLKSGVTIYEARGAYDNIVRTELVTILDSNQYKKLLFYIESNNLEAFVTVYNVSQVIRSWNNVNKLRN